METIPDVYWVYMVYGVSGSHRLCGLCTVLAARVLERLLDADRELLLLAGDGVRQHDLEPMINEQHF